MKIELYKNDLPDNFEIEGDVAIDTETMGLDLHRDRLCVVQISNGDGICYLVQFDGKDYSAPNLKKLLLSEDKVFIFHYARFDIAVLKNHFDANLQNVFCTKIASKLTRTYTGYHGLKDLHKELLGVSISKQQQCSNWGAEELSDDQKEYAANDVLNLCQIRSILEQRLQNIGRLDMANKLFAFIQTRAELDLLGWNDIDIFSHNS